MILSGFEIYDSPNRSVKRKILRPKRNGNLH